MKSTNITYQYSDHITIDWLVKNLPQFLFPNLAKQQARIEKPFIGWIAAKDRQPVGLILANGEVTQRTFRIHSFLVHPQFQNQKIGTTLFKKLEETIKSINGQKIELVYKSHWKSVDYIQLILKRNNWGTPKSQLIMTKWAVDKVLSYFSKSSILDTFFLFPFTQLKKSDTEFIQNKKQSTKGQWFDKALEPFLASNTIDLQCSFALKSEDEIIGWIVAHRIQKDLNELTALFIDEKHRRFKLAYGMILTSLLAQQKLGIPQFLVTSKLDGNAVGKLLSREGERNGLFCTTSYYVEKHLDKMPS